jgi:hypothetical protein
LNHTEYGLASEEETISKPIDVHFNPSEYGILNDYSVVKEIYRVMLSPTIITLTTHKETNMVSKNLAVIHVFDFENSTKFNVCWIIKPVVIYPLLMLSSENAYDLCGL